ncbi:hypothetical protein ACTNBM_07605 [Lachnospiraceae bacterium HCP1S3_C3]
MRKIWIGLCIICLGLAVYGGVYDQLTGQFNDDSITVIVFFVLLAGIFGFLTWLWRGKSPVERTVEQAAAVVEDIKEKMKRMKNIPLKSKCEYGNSELSVR